MPELNKANRTVGDVHIDELATKKPFLFFETANTTTVGLSADSVYAMKKGTRAIAFQNPIEGTMTIEAQVLPFKLYSLFSDGVIESTAFYRKKETIKCTTAGQLEIEDESGEIQEGTIFVYPMGEYAEEPIEGTFSGGTFNATTASEIEAEKMYEVGYFINANTGVRRVSFNNKKVPKDYILTMETVDKNEDGVLSPFIITAYKASVQRNFELAFSSEGEPATITITFDLMEDKNGDVLDMIEKTPDSE